MGRKKTLRMSFPSAEAGTIMMTMMRLVGTDEAKPQRKVLVEEFWNEIRGRLVYWFAEMQESGFIRTYREGEVEYVEVRSSGERNRHVGG